MQALPEPISVRVARINSEITGNPTNLTSKCTLLSRECLLDAFQALYDECTIETLKKHDPNIADFVEKYKSPVREMRQLRVNKLDFEIKNVVGRGHFGEVHVVKEKQTGDVYAMKTIKKLDNDSKRAAFRAERNIMAFSQSPWLTKLQYAFQDNSYLFFIMEYHPGGDLLGLLQRQGGTLPESAATFYIAELVLALEDLHKMGYVHRDIKPDNLLLDRCGHLKLADFGSAAKLNSNNMVNDGPPVGTPDYIAPEVLQSVDNRTKNNSYGISCDFWSMGVLAYELTVGSSPFSGPDTTTTYAKIMSYKNNLKFPPEIVLSQAYMMFIKHLIIDAKSRLSPKQIRNHTLFKHTNFDTLKDQVPPFVPKITSQEDTSNFADVNSKSRTLSIENFKKKNQFSGRNLPFVGFTFTQDSKTFEAAGFEKRIVVKDEAVQNLKSEVESLRKKLMKSAESGLEKEAIEKKLEEKCRKLESVESLRDRLERDLANHIAESAAIKRTLELERKDRVELEQKALNLIKSAKQKWELSEKNKIEVLQLELEKEKEKVQQLASRNTELVDQLQESINQHDKHKESFEKVQNFSRRSVIGLESRLEKVTVDTQNKIFELESRLSEERHEKILFEKKLDNMREKESSMVRQLKESEAKYRNLQSQVDEAEQVISKLSDQVTILESDIETIDSYKKEILKLKESLNAKQVSIKDLENENRLLKMEGKNLEQNITDLKEGKEKLANAQYEKRIAELESQLVEVKDKNSSLIKQLKDSQEGQNESQELREMRTKLWRMEKEFGNCKIDKRILERELKDAQKEVADLNAKIETVMKSMQENKKKNETALLELNDINEALSLELMKTKDLYKNLEERLDNQKEKCDEEKSIITELKGIIKLKEEKMTSLSNEMNSLKVAKSQAETQVKTTENEKKKFMNLVETLQKEKAVLFNELDKAKRETENKNENLNALREACMLLEEQVVEYEKISVSLQSKQDSFKETIEKLKGDLSQAKQDILAAKKQGNEEKSMRLLAETKVKRLTEDVECLQNECSSYKEQCHEYKEYSNGLADELTMTEEKLTDYKINVASYERQVEDLMGENRVLKEEIAIYLTQVANVKESNYELNHNIKDLKESQNFLTQKIAELERILQENTNFYKQRELKSDSTVKQQIKLIDYLQTKLDEQSTKKKTFTDILFGHSKKENQPPFVAPLNYKDLETQLFKERQTNKELQEQIFRLKAESSMNILDKVSKVDRHRSEIVSPRTKVAMEQIAKSPQKGDLLRQNSAQRMHHNIPHRFESKLCTTQAKCANCSNPMILGRNINECKECNILVHTNCTKSMPRTCGLPKGLAKHYKESLTKLSETEKAESNRNSCEDVVNVESWIKLPNKTNGWDKRYAQLKGSMLNIYTNVTSEKNSKLIESIDLKPANSHGKLILEVQASELGVQVANSDIPFILKIEIVPNTTCWPSKGVVLLTLSVEEKEKWFKALEKLFYNGDKLKTETVFKIPENLQINCVFDLTDNIKLIGTEKGLYSFYNETLLYINAVNSVHHIAVIPSTNVVVMIVNAKSTLIACDLNHLINLTQCAPVSKPTLKYKNVNVNNLDGFHIMQVSKFADHRKLCVATTKQLIILQYELELDELKAIRILDTAKPISCILFTENSLIVGADKFFEIDLTSFQAEEFLDMSDVKLKQAIKCYKMGSFPLAIMQVSKNPREYLLSFNEFSVFVDEYGQSTRENEMKATHLRMGFHYAKSYLYVIQFAAVEIHRIGSQTCNSDESLDTNADYVRIALEKLSFVGSSKNGIYVCHEGDLKFIDGKKYIEVDSCSEMSESTENGNDSDRFSFTSSMVQSLDGNLSDTESDLNEYKQKKVKFSQTNL